MENKRSLLLQILTKIKYVKNTTPFESFIAKHISAFLNKFLFTRPIFIVHVQKDLDTFQESFS